MQDIDRIRYEESLEQLKDKISAYFGGKFTSSGITEFVHDLSKRRPFNVWECYFMLLIDAVKRPQSAEKVSALLSDNFRFFITHCLEADMCKALRAIFANILRSNPNYPLFLTAFQSLFSDANLFAELLKMEFVGAESTIVAFPDAVGAIFAVDYFCVLFVLKLFAGLYLEDRISDVEKKTLQQLVGKTPTAVAWAFLLFGRPLFGAYRNLQPELAFALAGRNSLAADFEDFLKVFGVSIAAASVKGIDFETIFGEITADCDLPDWFAGFWRAVLVDDVPPDFEKAVGGGDEWKIFRFIIEILYPKGAVLNSLESHALTIDRDKSLESCFFKEHLKDKTSMKLLMLMISFDIEFAYDAQRCTISPRLNRQLIGFFGSVIMTGSNAVAIKYANAIEKLHAKYISDKKLNISLIYLFKESFRVQALGGTGTRDTHYDLEFGGSSTSPANSILLFVTECLAFEQIVLLSNEYLLYERLLNDDTQIIEHMTSIDAKEWSVKQSFKKIVFKLFQLLFVSNVEYVDAAASLDAKRLVFKTVKLDCRKASKIYSLIKNASAKSAFIKFIVLSYENSLFETPQDRFADLFNVAMLLNAPTPASSIDLVALCKSWFDALSSAVHKYCFLEKFCAVLSKRLFAKSTLNCVFDVAVESLLPHHSEFFWVFFFETVAFLDKGSMPYDRSLFPYRAILTCLQNNVPLLQSLIKKGLLNSKHVDFIVVDVLIATPFACDGLFESIPEARILFYASVEKDRFGTRIILDKVAAKMSLRAHSVDLYAAVFAVGGLKPSMLGITELEVHLKKLSFDDFGAYIQDFLFFADSSADFIMQDPQIVGYIVLFLKVIFERLTSSRQYLRFFEQILFLRKFVVIFQAARLKHDLLAKFVPEAYFKNVDNPDCFNELLFTSFFAILKNLLRINKVNAENSLYRDIFGVVRARFFAKTFSFVELSSLVNLNGSLNDDEKELLEHAFKQSSPSAAAIEACDICVFHAEKNPLFFLGLLSTCFSFSEAVFKRIEKDMQKKGYISWFIISSCHELKEIAQRTSSTSQGQVETGPNKIPSVELLEDILSYEKLFDIVFWKKLDKYAWICLFDLINNTLFSKIGRHFADYLARNVESFDWLLRNVYREFGHEAHLEVCKESLQRLLVGNEALIRPFSRNAFLCGLTKTVFAAMAATHAYLLTQLLIDCFEEDRLAAEDKKFVFRLAVACEIDHQNVDFAPFVAKLAQEFVTYVQTPTDPQMTQVQIALFIKLWRIVQPKVAQPQRLLADLIVPLRQAVCASKLIYFARLFDPVLCMNRG